MEKYVITGSLGHISKPLAKGLIKLGKKVSILTSNPDKVSEIEKIGAKALVGSVQNPEFIMEAFKNADAVYTMIPPIWETKDWRASQIEVARIYTEALKANRVKYVVNLSSVGAHAPNGNGPVNGLHDFEQMLNGIEGLHVKHLRPAYFFYNFSGQIELIKKAGIMGGNFGNEKLFLVDPKDIAEAALEELSTLNFQLTSERYIISDERTGAEIAAVLGKAAGKEIQWVDFSDEQQKEGLLSAGVPLSHSENFTEMGRAIRTGTFNNHVKKNLPKFSTTKLEDFAKEFAVNFNK